MTRWAASRLPRGLHPLAWWVWALGLATAASRTTNPVLLAVILAVAAYVVVVCRSDAPWARSFSAYLVLGLMVVAIRVVFNALLGARPGGQVLFTLPEATLPDWAAGIALGGPVTAEEVLAASYDGLRLATLICCIGAANALANPKRALRVLPPALYEVGVAVVVALTVAPQLVESVQRVRRARRLRGAHGRGLTALRAVAVPVLQDALDRSLALAAAMDSRGYGRSMHVPARTRRLTSSLVLLGLGGLCLGVYALLDGTAPAALGLPVLLAGAVVAVGAIAVGGRRTRRTSYRGDPWLLPEWLVAGSGVAAAAVLLVTGGIDPAALHPSLDPLAWPDLPVVAVAGVLVALLPVLAAPPPERTTARTPRAPVAEDPAPRERVPA
ncbi:MAG TPA: CbiQ family ECF transporter T component [Actinomycetales bacterium]|nr:CbiQ family ECF transporter T component [Actinomycetales bacterium]